MAEDQVAFVDHRTPVLPPGDYRIEVEQKISLDAEVFTANRLFTVGGDRFTLPPAEIRGVFPPDGSLGDHVNVLPHVVLERPTLPWERSPGGGVDGPWLALLLFSEAERPPPHVITVAELTGGDAYFPAIPLERGQSTVDKVTVIDVRRDVLADLLPTAGDLPRLAHVRRGDGADTAVVIGGNLPAAGVTSTVHLVSLEGRFHAPAGAPEFDFGPAEPVLPVRLITLASWRFACVAAEQTFAALVRDLAGGGAGSRSLRLPDSGDPRGDTFLRQGFVPVRHARRDGGRTVSWYRGPFTTGPVAEEPAAPVRSPDRLLRYHADVGMFDVGHAAAWQLGRLLMLRSTDVATALYEWRRRRAHSLLRPLREPGRLYPLTVADIDMTLPPGVLTWFTGLNRLDGVPFAYLLPDERLLPVESIRFLQLDRQWVRHLVDGAYSIGRLSEADAELDLAHPLPLEYRETTGVLIRSDVVSGYPGLIVDGFGEGRTALPATLSRRLAPNILLCLFEGVLTELDVHQQPESLHFAVERPEAGKLGKTLRDAAGDPGPSVTPVDVGPRGRIPVAALVERMATVLRTPTADLTSGAFARQMIEVAERVTFRRTS